MPQPQPSVIAEIARLRTMRVAELRQRYLEVFGEESRSRNKDYLWKRIAYRIQELAEGGISDRAKKRAAELANELDLRVRHSAPLPAPPPPAKKRDPRLPPAGTEIVRRFNDADHHVRILDDGFEYGGRTYKSLSAVAKVITGTHWNGFGFFDEALKEAQG